MHADYNGSAGIDVASSGFGTASFGVKLSNTELNDEPTGVNLAAGTQQVTASNLVTDRDSIQGIIIQSTSILMLSDWRAQDDSLAAGGAAIANAGNCDVTIQGARIRKTQNSVAGTWSAINVAGGSTSVWNVDGMTVEKVGAVTGLVESFVIQAATTFNITNSKTIGSVDYAMTPFAGTSKIGFGCDFSSATHPYGFGLGGTLTSAQDGSELPFTMAGGTQSSAWTMASSLVLSGTNGTINLPPVPGMQYTVINGGSGSAVIQGTGGSGPTITTGKKTIVRVNDAGNIDEITALL